MICLYTKIEPRKIEIPGAYEIKISGTYNDWILFAQKAQRDMSQIECERVNDPSPYSYCASKIVIQHNNGSKLLIDVDNNGNIIVIGLTEICNQLSRLLNSFANQYRSGQHYHLDYEGENYFVDEKSSYVVLAME